MSRLVYFYFIFAAKNKRTTLRDRAPKNEKTTPIGVLFVRESASVR